MQATSPGVRIPGVVGACTVTRSRGASSPKTLPNARGSGAALYPM
jgi:hypothetical protein